MLSPTAVPSHPNAPGDLGDHNLPPAHSSSAPEYFLHATQRLNERSRWAMVWMVGFAMLVIATVVALAWYLDHFEQEEELRRRGADAQWLEQSVLFHFRRLEDDVARLSQQAALGHAPTLAQPGKGLHDPQPNGLLWRTPGTILTHTWLTAHAGHNADLPLWREHLQAHPSNRQALDTLLDITTGLRRSSYAGPMRNAQGQPTDTVWLAVPYFERGEFLGNYMAALSLQASVQGLVPAWFHRTHRVRLAGDAAAPAAGPPGWPGPAGALAHLAALNLPGTDVFLEVTPLQAQPATVPRLFLWVALTFLAGMLISLAVLRRDMAKRQQVQALLQAQMVLRTAMENSTTLGMRAWARDGRVLYVNEAFCRMVGYSAAELLGRRAPMPYWPSHLTEVLQAQHRDVTTHGTRGEGIEVQFQHRDGHRVDVLVHEAPLTTANGEHVGWMSSVLDTSDKKRAERLAAQQQERLEASGRLVAVGEVASTLAHELNQPLGALSSFANGLLNRLRSHSIALEDIAPVVARMAQLSDKAGGIIQRVNAFARRRELVLAPVELSGFVQRCIAAHPHSAAARVQWSARHPSTVQADSLLLEHVVNNLLANALAWSARSTAPAQVQVSVDSDAAAGMARLAVADNGPGVAPEVRERIFSAFFSTHEGGMGMGLAICRSIVEAHHGRIEVDSDPLLGGARLTVWLPLGPPAAQPPCGEAP